MIKLSRGRYVGLSVCLSSALWKNGGSDPDAVFRQHRSEGSRDEACTGVWDRSTGRGTFRGEFGALHCNKWGLTFAATRASSQITLGRLVRSVGRDTHKTCQVPSVSVNLIKPSGVKRLHLSVRGHTHLRLTTNPPFSIFDIRHSVARFLCSSRASCKSNKLLYRYFITSLKLQCL